MQKSKLNKKTTTQKEIVAMIKKFVLFDDLNRGQFKVVKYDVFFVF